MYSLLLFFCEIKNILVVILEGKQLNYANFCCGFAEGAEPLSWSTRLKIAIGAARGLAFLHNSEKSVIYRDFKTSNILLDAVSYFQLFIFFYFFMF